MGPVLHPAKATALASRLARRTVVMEKFIKVSWTFVTWEAIVESTAAWPSYCGAVVVAASVQ
jgi:hypothetical protein